MTNKFSIKFLALTLFCLAFGVGQIFAQAGAGNITGVVSDSTGAVVPNATVKLANINTGSENTATASDQGIYNFTNLQPGRYRVSASSGSFAVQNLEVEVQVGRTTDANFALGAGDVSATVEVTAEGIQTTESKPDAVLNQTAISNLPINGRRFQDFVTLTPTAQVDPQRGQISLSGQRGINTNINVDGVDFNQPFFGGIRGGERGNSAFTVPQESIREFQVVAAGYSAEFGRSSGGIVNAVTKSGSNNVRGTLFYLIRPEKFARANSFATALQEQRLSAINIDATLAPTQQQFGGSIGGPIVKDKLFYFGSYEQQRFRAPRVVLFRNLIGLTPTPAQQEAFNYFRSLETEFTQTNDAYGGLGKIDWNVNNNNRFGIRFNYSKNTALNGNSTGETSVDPTTTRALSSNGTESNKNFATVGQLISNITASAINDLRFQYAREDRPRISNENSPLVATSLGDFGTRSFLPSTQFDTRYQIIDSLTYVTGNHTFKVGGEYSRILADQKFGFNQFGAFNYFSSTSNILDVVSGVRNGNFLGRFDNTSVTYRKQIGNLAATIKVQELAFYGQDTWRITPRFTLNYGLRIEEQYNPSPETGNTGLIDAVKNGQFPIRGNSGFDATQIPDSGLQVGPRLGFAWDPAGDGKTVVRGYSGLYYARTPLLVLAAPFNNFREPAGDLSVQLPLSGFNQTSFNTFLGTAAGQAYRTITGCNPTLTPLPAACIPNTVYRQFAVIGIDLNASSLNNLPILTTQQVQSIASVINPTFNPQVAGLAPIGVDENFRNPRSFQFGFGVEREIAKNFTIGLDYSQVNTTNLQRNREINLPAPISSSAFADLLLAANTSTTVRSGSLFQSAIEDLRFVNRPIFAITTVGGLPSCAIELQSGQSCPTNARITIPRLSRPVSALGSLTLRESSARSLYRALTFRMRTNGKWGQLNAYYVLSKSLSDDDNERDATGFGLDNSFDLRREYGLARLDRTHQFTASPVIFLPFGFEVASTIRLRSGLPIDANISSDLNGDGIRNDRPFLVPGLSVRRNDFRNKSVFDVDLRVQKGFSFGEARRLIFSTEFFNIFNLSNIQISGSGTSNFCQTETQRCGLDGATNPNFLQIRDQTRDDRRISTFANFAGSQVFQFQLGARFQF